MISKGLSKLIRSLEQKKYRRKEQLFVAEGEKLILELMGYYECNTIISTPEWNDHHRLAATHRVDCSKEEIRKNSLMVNQSEAIALFRQKRHELDQNDYTNALSLVLDTIQDPGNMGTIIRVADWFGIRQVICSMETADLYNPKTVQATMGALARVKVVYCDLLSFLRPLTGEVPIYATTLDGENIYSRQLTSTGLLIMGNEGNGISSAVAELATDRLFIPSFSNEKQVESLNVAIATAIACSEFKRRG